MLRRPKHTLTWIIYATAVALYAVGYAMHRLFAPRRPGRRPAAQVGLRDGQATVVPPPAAALSNAHEA